MIYLYQIYIIFLNYNVPGFYYKKWEFSALFRCKVKIVSNHKIRFQQLRPSWECYLFRIRDEYEGDPRLSSPDLVHLSFACKHVFRHLCGNLPVRFPCRQQIVTESKLTTRF